MKTFSDYVSSVQSAPLLMSLTIRFIHIALAMRIAVSLVNAADLMWDGVPGATGIPDSLFA